MQRGTCPPLERAWTAEEGAAMVAEWRKSGLSANAFCRERGFGLHRLRYWATRGGEEARPADFVVVPLDVGGQSDADAVQPASRMLEIQIGRAVVRMPMSAGRAAIAETLRAVLEVA